MRKFDVFINEVEDKPFPSTIDDVDQPKVYKTMKDWLYAHGIFIQDMNRDHVRQATGIEDDNELDMATDKLKYLLSKNK